MTDYITLLKPVHTTDSYGGEKTEYEKTKRVHAERVKMTGRRSEEVSEHFPDYSVRWHIRDVHEVGDNWRVQHEGGSLYTVVAIEPNRQRGMNTLICEKVNE